MIDEKLADLEKELYERKSLTIDERVAIYNKIVSMASDFLDIDHPSTKVQLVKVDNVIANDYNPNKVAPPEMELLKLSIKKDGITMPVVVSDNGDNTYTVVDGFHRTTVVKSEKDIRKVSSGYLPVVKLNKSVEDRITSTVRHNIARGSHSVELTSKLILLLRKHNWTDQKIGKELGMDPDEILRLKQITGLAEMFSDKEFSRAWNPKFV